LLPLREEAQPSLVFLQEKRPALRVLKKVSLTGKLQENPGPLKQLSLRELLQLSLLGNLKKRP
jgi:hypothetical protein